MRAGSGPYHSGVAVTTAQALAWRLDRHHLVSGACSVRDVVRRLIAVPAWSGNPDLAVRRRVRDPRPEVVQRALQHGELIRTFAFRGATHLMAAEDAGVHLSVRAAGRQWELPAWRKHYALEPGDWPALRAAVREAVGTGAISQAELVDAVTATRRFRHLRAGLADRSHTLLKPFAWQGDLCLGPPRDGRATFQSPAASPLWDGIPPLDEAGPRAVLAYLDGYGPASRDRLHYWLVAGLSAGRRRLDGWVADLVGHGVVEIEVGGEPMLHAREHLDDLMAREPGAGVVLLPGHDQWVLGAGTTDERIVPPARRSEVTRGANVVLHAGVVCGTWTVAGDRLSITWFREAGSPPHAQIDVEVERLGELFGLGLGVTVTAG